VNNGGIALQGLYQVGFDGIFQQDRHGPFRFEIFRINRLTFPGVTYIDIATTLLEVFKIIAQTKDSHDLRGRSNVESGFPRHPSGLSAQGSNDIAQPAVVHVHAAFPEDRSRVDPEVSGLGLNVIVDQGSQQVVGLFDRIEVPRKMQVDVRHGNDLAPASPGGSPLDPENGSQAGFPDHSHGLLADMVQPVSQPYGYSCFPFSGRGRGDGCHQYQVAIPYLFRLDQGEWKLGFVGSVIFEVVF